MFIPKRYGMSKNQTCPFCGKTATTENKQGVYVCIKHKNEYLDLKCICGEWLDVLSGKWGPYCKCSRCGNVSWSKAMEANPNIAPKNDVKTSEPKPVCQRNVSSLSPSRPQYGPVKDKKKETVVRSDELDFY